MNTLKTLSQHTINAAKTFLANLERHNNADFNIFACEFHNSFDTKHIIDDDVYEYFPKGVALEQVSDEDYSKLSALFSSVINTKEAIIANANFLILFRDVTTEVHDEIELLEHNIAALERGVNEFITALEKTDFSGHHPVE